MTVNRCIAILYENGADNIYWHFDKIDDLVPNSTIFAVSFGDVRTLEVARMSDGEVGALELASGSLYELDWKTNLQHVHRIKPEKKYSVGPRWCFTFRHVAPMLDSTSGQVKDASGATHESLQAFHDVYRPFSPPEFRKWMAQFRFRRPPPPNESIAQKRQTQIAEFVPKKRAKTRH
jgi:hypothetical protein